jgi:D-glycero-alpha-D-manno-heptose-7-phosphate kinase
MKDLVEEGISILNSSQDINVFGKLLYEAWQAKQSLSSKVSNSYIDEIYDQALSTGAVGGKLLGAGGGGFMLLFVHPCYQQKVREKLSNLTYVPFRFEFSGSQIIFFDPEMDYFVEEEVRAKKPAHTS